MPEPTRPQDVPDDLLIAALSAWTGKPLHSLHDLIAVDVDDHDAMERTLRAVLPAHERQVRERVTAENGQDWTRDTPDSQLTIVRLACGHAKIVLANVGAPGPGSSTWCDPCVSSVGALRYVAPQRVASAYERQVRDRLAAEFRDAAQAIEDSAGENRDPLAEEIWQTCERDPEVPAVREDPRTIATVAYRHLASRLAAGEPGVAGMVLISTKDLAELLDYAAGRGDVRVVQEETVARAFAALKATIRSET